MHPTMTEHDFRFPRRPGDAATGPRKPDRFDHSYTPAGSTTAAARIATAAPGMMTTGPGGLRAAGLHDVRLDVPLTHGGAHPEALLRTAAFPPFQQSAARANQNLDEMQRQDPLATQVWKFYAKTKQLLPAQERMENLTWRMMHLKLQRTKAAIAINKYVSDRRGFRFWGVLEDVDEEELLTWRANEETTVLPAHQPMPPAGLRNCASRRSMPRCSRRTR
jgi:GATA-binding protein